MPTQPPPPAKPPLPAKPVASLSLDLDNKWSYLKTRGERSWEAHPSYLDLLVPRVLGILREKGLTITFFIVGQDAALERNREALSAIARAGHEVGNHSFRHEPWLHLYSDREVEEELGAAEEHIQRATGRTPIGFRGPGFSFSPAVLRCLIRRGYLYDASTFPTYLGPLARAYYFLSAKLTREEREKRKALFGGLKEGMRPLEPYRFQLDGSAILEIPVTTMPFLKAPIHASYILYLSAFSRIAARIYFRAALDLCRMTGTPPSLLLHPLDFLGKEDDGDLSFFPAMNLPREKKLEVMDEVLRLLCERFTVVPMAEQARALAARGDLRTMDPSRR